ncbi:YqzE family protein [Peribacillus sp. SCS-155]|uniref:YqzE family protein n=1 Tax=Peribacillus sedimenti TaxID=3115297 RepID=UPI003906796E
MKTNDLIKFLTQQIVRYLELPREDKKMRKENRKKSRETLYSHWFGMIPFSLMLILKRK